MYTCKIFFKNDIEKEILIGLLNHRLIKYHRFFENYVEVKTRKLWKFLWIANRFKVFYMNFCYVKYTHKLFKNQYNLPKYINDNFDVNISLMNWSTFKISITFSNVNDIWKIYFLLLNK